MLRDVIEILDFLDNSANSAEAFVDLLPDGSHSIEITPFESELGTTNFIKILFPQTIKSSCSRSGKSSST